MTDWEGFEMVGRLGAGSTATVWLARQVSLGRLVAVKELAPELAADVVVRGRLGREALVLAGLEHPNCVAVYRYLESTSAAALVMEYVEGVSLRVLVEGGPLGVEEALAVLEGALEGLAYAHGRHVVHGDVKPENILLATTGQSKLVDFGLAGAVGARRAAGTGSPLYASPEAAAGEALGAASDLYSAGLVLFELLTGVTAPPGGLAAGVDAHTAGLGAPVAALLRRALDPDPAVRPADAVAFLEELRGAAEQQCGPDWRRRALLVPLIAAATAGAASAVGVAKATAAPLAPTRPATGTRAGARAARLVSAHSWVAAATAAVIVVAGAFGIGYAATNTSHQAAPTPAAAQVSSPSTTTPTTTTPAPLSATSVTQLVTTFYNQYLACQKPNRAGPSCENNTVKQYGTASLDSYYTPASGYQWDVDPIACAQNIPTGVQVSGVTTTANKASGTVTEQGFAQPNTTRFVVVDQSGTLKINTITCNPPVTPDRVPGGSGTGTSLNGTYTISLPPGDAGCGFPSLSDEILTVNATTASITAVGGGIPFTGTATTTGVSTFSMRITNDITDAPGAIVIDLTGSVESNGDLSGQSVNSGIFPGGTNGFGCNSPFTAIRTSATAGPSTSSEPTSTLLAGSAAPCTQAAITAAAQAVDGASFDGLADGSDGFGCSGRFAYTFVTVGSGGEKDGITLLLMATNGAWQPASQETYCENGSVPQAIYQQACETN